MQLLLDALTYYRGSDEPLSVVLILVARVALVVATGWLAGRALFRVSAAVEHRVWLLAALGTLVVPLLWALTPGWRLPLLALHVPSTQPGVFASGPLTAGSFWPELLVAVWITGTVAGLAYMGLGIVLARRLFARSLPCRDPAWLDALASARREAGVSRRVELRIAPCSMSPAVWGFRRVRILVPAESGTWPLELRHSVLVHELAHVVRHDCASQMIANLACAVWWFHPLVWYAAARVRALAEQAADDCVIRAGSRRADYAEALLTIATTLGWARLPGAVQTMFHPSHLERRLRAILDPTRRRNALGNRLSVATILIACALMILLATLSPSVVRAVPHTAVKLTQQPLAHPPRGTSAIDQLEKRTASRTDLNERLADRAAELQQRYIVSMHGGRPTRVDVEPPVTMQLIPNWEGGRHAEMLIPNHTGEVQTLLVEQLRADALAAQAAATRSAAAR